METPWYKQKTFWGIALTVVTFVAEKLFGIMPNPAVYATLLGLFTGLGAWGVVDKIQTIKEETPK
jgi:hypothetical protein